jgi:prepilin-type N-terminal cleavage/methylation domain-containing protein
MKRRGFTLIELLVVMAIISILMALLMPAVQQAREAARRTQCRNNLHQIGLALLNYASSHQCLPPGWLTSRVGNFVYPGYTSWLISILPQMEQTPLYNALNYDLPAWDAANETVVTQRLDVYLCPSDTAHGEFVVPWLGRDLRMTYSNYVGSLGTNFILDYYDYGSSFLPDGVLFRRSNVRFKDIVDGTTHTLLAGERVNNDPLCRPVWGFGATSFVTADSSHGISWGEHERLWGFSSQHNAGAHFVMCDGSAGLFTRDIDTALFLGLSTRDGQEEHVASPLGGLAP